MPTTTPLTHPEVIAAVEEIQAGSSPRSARALTILLLALRDGCTAEQAEECLNESMFILPVATSRRVRVLLRGLDQTL